VVFDIHPYINNLIGSDATWPVISEVPPGGGNLSDDCISLVFDNPDRFVLFASPHIVRNTIRVLMAAGLDDTLVTGYLGEIMQIVADSGGAVCDPGPVMDHGVSDFEDNHILALALAVDADLIVSDDTDLTQLSPWLGRRILRPRDFVYRYNTSG